MEFYVKHNVDLTKYGFYKKNEKHYWWRRKNKYNGALGMSVSLLDMRISFQSPSKDCIAVVCEMYKNGDIEMVEEDDLVQVRLTQEEVELIKERRKK